MPSFGGWACYDHHARRWVSQERLQSLAAAWAEQHSTGLDDPLAMDGVAYAGDWADLEVLQAPQDVGEGFVLKHDLPRLDALLATEWELRVSASGDADEHQAVGSAAAASSISIAPLAARMLQMWSIFVQSLFRKSVLSGLQRSAK